MTFLFVPHVEAIIVFLQLEICKVCGFGGVKEDCRCGSILRRMEGEKLGCGEGGE